MTAKLYVNPNLRDDAGATNDTALFSWSCPDGAGKVPVISISNNPLASREKVMYGKVMGGKEGLYNANVSREEGQIGGFRIGEALDTVVQNPLVAIEQGDSGGGLFRRLADGNLELVGILSSKPAGDRAGEPEGNYATNRSLDFLKCVKASLERPALAQK